MATVYERLISRKGGNPEESKVFFSLMEGTNASEIIILSDSRTSDAPLDRAHRPTARQSNLMESVKLNAAEDMELEPGVSVNRNVITVKLLGLETFGSAGHKGRIAEVVDIFGKVVEEAAGLVYEKKIIGIGVRGAESPLTVAILEGQTPGELIIFPNTHSRNTPADVNTRPTDIQRDLIARLMAGLTERLGKQPGVVVSRKTIEVSPPAGTTPGSPEHLKIIDGVVRVFDGVMAAIEREEKSKKDALRASAPPARDEIMPR